MNSMTTPFGLGDLAYYVFRPVVLLIDATWGTDLRDCDMCKARRKRWNAIASAPRWVVIFLVTMCVSVFWWRAK